MWVEIVLLGAVSFNGMGNFQTGNGEALGQP